VNEDAERLAACLHTVGADIVRPVRGGRGGGLEGISAPAEAGVELDMVMESDGAVSFGRPGALTPSTGGLEAVGERPEIHRVRFSDLPGNALHEAIARLDAKRTPNQGLRSLGEHGLGTPDWPAPGRILLIVHGTFSNAESLIDGLTRADPAFLPWAMQTYAQVLTFDYATMSRSAMANAMTLRRLLAPYAAAEIDVISHSQGGLVTRYWLEVFEPQRLATTRSIFVAGTLAGTSLAAPPALRRTLGLLTSIARSIGMVAEVGSTAIPLFGYFVGLFGILEQTLGFISKAPVFDAGVAIIPGFQGMSRVGNNAELDELRQAVRGVPAGYFAVTCDFEPEPLTWRFWRRFVSRVADGAADRLFNAPNDLVVDTVAQTEVSDSHVIGDQDPSRVLTYRTPNSTIHHTNVFSDARTTTFLRSALQRE
jgi:triacylglycerol esterase/lipase EstA (alpha/beta hydrolase family)